MVFSREFPKLTQEIDTIGTDNIIYKIVRIKNDYIYSPYYEEQISGFGNKLLSLDASCLSNVITDNEVEILTTELYCGYNLEEDTDMYIFDRNKNEKHFCKISRVNEINGNCLKIYLKEILGLEGKMIGDFDVYIYRQGDVTGVVQYESPLILNTPYSELKTMFNDTTIHQQLVNLHGVTQKTLQKPKNPSHIYPSKVAYTDTTTRQVFKTNYSDDIVDLFDDPRYVLGTYVYTEGFVFAYTDLDMARRAVDFLTEQRMNRNVKKREDDVCYDQPEMYQYAILKGEIPETYPSQWYGTPEDVDVYYVKTMDKSTNIAATALGFYEIVEEYEPFIFPPEDNENEE